MWCITQFMIKKAFLSLFLVMFSFGGTIVVSAEEIIQENIGSDEVIIEAEKNTTFSEQGRDHDDDEDEDNDWDEDENYDQDDEDEEENDDQDDEDEDEDEDNDWDEEENNSQIVTIIADMIVCESETLLPNWGNGGSNITSTTAGDFVTSTEGCEFKSGRLFQWGDDLMSFPGDTFFGEALGWFTTDSTDSNGRVEFTVDLNDLDAPNRIEMRQVLEEGDITFTYAINGNNSDSVSAEFYCHDDVLNYDNWDWINNPSEDTTYYCIGFNVEEPQEPQFCPVGNLIENGSFENPSLESGWDVFTSGETGWDTEWVEYHEGQPEDALLEIQNNLLVTAQDGNQYVELDTDWGFANGEPAGVAISQTIDTIIGKEYTVEFYTHARPETGEEENTLDFTITQGDENSTTYEITAISEWVKHTFTFVAEEEEVSIYFTYTGVENSLGIFLDNVSVTCGDVVDEEEEDDSDEEDEDDQDDSDDEEEEDDSNEEENDDSSDDSEEENNDNEQEDDSNSQGGGSSTGTRRGSVLGAFSQGEVLGASDEATCPVFTKFHKKGDVGGEVSMIQQFLNEHMQAGLTVDGVYGPGTEKAVHVFQQKYWDQTIKPWTPELSGKTTGRWYKTTRAWANELVDCREPSQVLEDTGRTYSTDMFVKDEETAS